MKADAFQNFDKYELFPLLDAADLVGMTDIVDLCLSHLEEDAYEPIRFSKFDFINCRESVFRNVILSLNDSKFEDPQMGIPDAAIIETINDYCKHNFYSEEKRS